MNKEQIIKKLRDMAKHPTVTLPRDTEALRLAAKLLEQSTEQEPVAWVDLLKQAQEIVEAKFLWKRFIDGTPLANDIACWMADFVQQHIRHQEAALTEQEPVAKAVVSKRVTNENHITNIDLTLTEAGKRLASGEHCLYTSPPQPQEAAPLKPLTDEEIKQEFEKWAKANCLQGLEPYGDSYHNAHTRNRWQGWLAAYRAIEAAHGIKEKNT